MKWLEEMEENICEMIFDVVSSRNYQTLPVIWENFKKRYRKGKYPEVWEKIEKQEEIKDNLMGYLDSLMKEMGDRGWLDKGGEIETLEDLGASFNKVSYWKKHGYYLVLNGKKLRELRKGRDANIAIEIELRPTYKDYGLIQIPKRYRGFFPPPQKRFRLISDEGDLTVKVDNQSRITGVGKKTPPNLKSWFGKHSDLKQKDKLIIKVVEWNVKYRLGIVEW